VFRLLVREGCGIWTREGLINRHPISSSTSVRFALSRQDVRARQRRLETLVRPGRIRTETEAAAELQSLALGFAGRPLAGGGATSAVLLRVGPNPRELDQERPNGLRWPEI
jgi:hypothetical protein